MPEFLNEHNPPAGPMGWLGIEAEVKAMDLCKEAGMVMDIESIRGDLQVEIEYLNDIRCPEIWEQERSLNRSGKLPLPLIPTYSQETGDCVSFGVKNAGERRQVTEIYAYGQEEVWKEWFAPWIYAISRNQIGGGMSGAGSTGAWGAAAVNQHGVLFADDPGVPSYSGNLADSWGSSRNARSLESAVYGKYASVAKDNPIQIVECKSLQDVTLFLRAHRPVAIASNWGFRVVTKNGRRFFTPSGSWSHQMVWIQWDNTLQAAYRLNSWGADAHPNPLANETPGGAWNSGSDMEDELRSRDVEAFAFWDFKGFPGPVDPGIL